MRKSINRSYTLSHYNPSHKEIYMRRIALSQEREFTMLGVMLIVFTILTVASVAYHLYIIMTIGNEAKEHTGLVRLLESEE